MRVAAAITGDRQGAQDVVQEAFVRAVRQREGFQGRSDLGGWVWRIVVNAARDARARQGAVSQLLPNCELNDDREEHSGQVLVREAVEQLPERQRLVLFLRYYADLDYRAIGEAVAISEGTVAATLHAAHQRMRELLTRAQL
jgi:RNA polymerase sigma-70 factor (ECF subfamily)